jgi:hypothetical protein
VRRQISLVFAVLLAVLLALIGCGRPIAGSPAMGTRDVDPAYFFAGEVPTYGQTVSSDEMVMLAYLQAMRRIDPCGLVTRDVLVKIGEIGSVGTLFALDECDVDIKVPGETNRRFVSIEVVLTRSTGAPIGFHAAGLPVYEVYPGSCDYLLPLELSRLPGARPLATPDQPFVRIGMIAEDNCDFAQRLVRAIAPRVAALHLPVRDAVAAYPVALAARDPCQVLSVRGPGEDAWDIVRGRPYECHFDELRLSLKPQMFDPATETSQRREQDGVEVFVDEIYCSAMVFVGAPMQRKLVGGDFVDTGDVVIRPAVVVDGGDEHCDEVADVAGAATKLYT